MNKEDLYLKSSNHDIITLYIRPDTPKQKMLDLLKHEEPIISNIKSRVTRQGIEATFQRVKTFIENMSPSPNGYIICASPDRLSYVIDIRIERDLYRCGNEFFASPLEESLILTLNPVGILVIDTQEATIAYISNAIEILKHMTSGVEGKHSKGGQSQRRFERKREQEILMFFSRIGEASNTAFLNRPVTNILVGGPGQTKDKFLETKYLDYRLKEKVMDTFDIQYSSEDGIREILHLALPKLEKNAYAMEVKEVEGFFEIMGKSFEKAVYGIDEVRKNDPSLSKIIKLEEIPGEFKTKTIVIHFHGEHYDKIKNLGGIVGFKY